MRLIYDIGMYDGSDTEYYLSEGYKVVAVEANPALIDKAEKRFSKEIQRGQLCLVNAAIAETEDPVTLSICADDLGSSTIYSSHLGQREIASSYTVPGMPITSVFAQHGLPWFMKVDIEGADRLPVLALTERQKPAFLSFEVGNDFSELLDHAQSIGYTKFKLINQCNFLEIHEQDNIKERVARRLIKMVGYSEPMFAIRKGRKFTLRHSAGPGPWASSGSWHDANAILSRYVALANKNELGGWYDLHAS
jgi:FkbM family methyltransferase